MHRFALIGILFIFISCVKEDIPKDSNPMAIPYGFPEVVFPLDNAYTDARWALGKKLFYDPILSRDSSISCASCHLAAFAFSDTVKASPGVFGRPGTRNAPTLANVAYHPYFTREGGVASLEMQVAVPVQEHNEFDFNLVLISERLQKDDEYLAMAQAAYGRSPDPFVITRAIATFERSLLSGNSPYDQYSRGHLGALTSSEQRGLTLFLSEKTQCASCHSGFNFTNYSFENNGLYTEYADPGRIRLTGLEKDRALFKVPTLRNISLTAPYMHDGSISTLEAVVAHYREGGAGHVHQSALVRPLNITDQEAQDLVQFLKSLTDNSFIKNKHFHKE